MNTNLEQLFPGYFPIHDPVLIFSLVLFIILLAPVVLQRIKIPSIIGLILAGVAVGPNGFNILMRDEGIVLFGTVGLLYIMFLAGLEIDMNDFKKNRNKSMAFGAITFVVPMLLGTVMSYYLLGFGLMSSILLASMFASHTLLAYPIASRLGITKNKAVNITVGGTIITDTAALLVLAVITGASSGELNSQFWIRLGISLAIFSFIVLWVFPRITRWFFKNYETDGVAHYIFVLAMVFLAAFLAEIAGVEPIIGAFLAGLALNPLIPHTSPLMNRIEFVGNALFIPFFLIGVGMLVDLRVLFEGPEALIVAGAMIVAAIVSKWLAAFATEKAFGFTKTEGQLIFGLSSAQAAATLAAVLIGYRIELLNENVLNGTILMILVTCIISSFVTEKAAVKQAMFENEQAPDLSLLPQRILVPIASSDADTIEQLIDLAVLLKKPGTAAPIYPLIVVKDNYQSKEKLIESNKHLEKAELHAAATETAVDVLTRVDLNVTNGILRAIKDQMITEVVLSWNAKITATDKIFGSVLDNVLKKTGEMIFVAKLVQPVSTIASIKVVVPPRAEYEPGFPCWIDSIHTLVKQTSGPLTFYGRENTHRRIEKALREAKASAEVVYEVFDDWRNLNTLKLDLVKNDLLVIISARLGSISYHSYLPDVPKQLSKHFRVHNFLVIYPEQHGLRVAPDPKVTAIPAY
ncbi:cation:proton antiporter [Pontibacter diazotrophicus]|uniref:Cation:proton antiporter n=1 Tax=Pontibacter diazotrophicus TaxID=1400979 RepID=A0A3D8LAN0_9BACT|nr:cation:proton antiporter [Pontibacter diazotrophicus]RDV14384.1 cation:proton antiporter [Pontibacter diazotrophicus]